VKRVHASATSRPTLQVMPKTRKFLL